ncbi:MAG: zinc finger CCCH domain-containing protein [bacterium]|nr:zinc finger CCCH domain-containing protein [bacterium]
MTTTIQINSKNMVHNNNYTNNMYCSDDEGNDTELSEQTYEQDQQWSDEYDSDDQCNYDDPNSNSDETFVVSLETLRSETRLRHRRRLNTPPVILLLSMATSEQTGCETWIEWQEKMMIEKEKALHKKKEEEKKVEEEEKKVEEKKKKLELLEKARILATLPTETKLGRYKRMKKKEEEKRAAWLARKKKKKIPKKSLPFGHRRNGGGKSRSKKSTAAVGSKEEKIQIEVIKRRRALRKKVKKEEKKKEEEKRSLLFRNNAENKDTNVIEINYIKDEEEEDLETKMLEQEIKKQQTLMIQNIQLRKEAKEKVIELKKQKLEEDHANAVFAYHEALLRDERENGGWITVNKFKPKFKSNTEKEQRISKPKEKKKKEKKKKEKKKKEVCPFQFVTPRMAGQKKIFNKQEMPTVLSKTRICESVHTGKRCRHGKRCRFAHTAQELQIRECFFGNRCRCVKKTCSGYHNSGKKCCCFRHPEETNENYFRRMGLKKTSAFCRTVAKKVKITKVEISIMRVQTKTKQVVKESNSFIFWNRWAQKRKKVVEVKQAKNVVDVKKVHKNVVEVKQAKNVIDVKKVQKNVVEVKQAKKNVVDVKKVHENNNSGWIEVRTKQAKKNVVDVKKVHENNNSGWIEVRTKQAKKNVVEVKQAKNVIDVKKVQEKKVVAVKKTKKKVVAVKKTKKNVAVKKTKKNVAVKKTKKKERPLCRYVSTGKTCPHGKNCRFRHNNDPIVIRVPASLALQAMQHAIKSGIKNFKIEIV